MIDAERDATTFGEEYYTDIYIQDEDLLNTAGKWIEMLLVPLIMLAQKQSTQTDIQTWSKNRKQ